VMPERRQFLSISPSRTEFRAAYLLPIAWMAALVPVFEPGLARAEINNAGALAPYLLIADQAARLRPFEEARPNAAQAPCPHPRVPARGAWSGLPTRVAAPTPFPSCRRQTPPARTLTSQG